MRITHKNLHDIISKLSLSEVNVYNFRKNLDVIRGEKHFQLCFGQGEYFIIDENLFWSNDILGNIHCNRLYDMLEILLDNHFELRIKDKFMKLLKET